MSVDIGKTYTYRDAEIDMTNIILLLTMSKKKGSIDRKQ